MGRRACFKDIGYGLLHSFISRNNAVEGYWALGKLYLLARRQGVTTLSIDLLGHPGGNTLAAELAEVQATYISWLGKSLKRHALPAAWLKTAAVTLEFDRDDLRDIARARGYLDHPPFLCKVHLSDDRSREYVFQAIGACRPHDPIRESRSGG